MHDILTVRETVVRAKAEGLPLSEYTLRKWLKAGVIPYTTPGKKLLIYYPNVAAYLKGEPPVQVRPALTIVNDGQKKAM